MSKRRDAITVVERPPENPEKLPVIVVHYDRDGSVWVSCSHPVLIMSVDDAVPDDRVFVSIAPQPPGGLVHGPISHSELGDQERLSRFVEWVQQRLSQLGSHRRQAKEALH